MALITGVIQHGDDRPVREQFRQFFPEVTTRSRLMSVSSIETLSTRSITGCGLLAITRDIITVINETDSNSDRRGPLLPARAAGFPDHPIPIVLDTRRINRGRRPETPGD